MRILTAIAAILTAATIAAAPAAATVYSYTINGTVDPASFSADDEDLFGGDVLGSNFVATFLVDDSSPTALYDYGATASSAQGGGLIAPGLTPPLTATITIGGFSYQVRTGNFDELPGVDSVGDPVGPTITEHDSGQALKDSGAQTLTLIANYQYNYTCCFPVGESNSTDDFLEFTLSSALFTDPDYRQLGTFALADGSGGTFERDDEFISREDESINFTTLDLLASSLTVTTVPEPATWAMVIVGLGMMGGIMRRRATKTAST